MQRDLSLFSYISNWSLISTTWWGKKKQKKVIGEVTVAHIDENPKKGDTYLLDVWPEEFHLPCNCAGYVPKLDFLLFLWSLFAPLLFLMVTSACANKLQPDNRTYASYVRLLQQLSPVPFLQQLPSIFFPEQSQQPSTASPPRGSPTETWDGKLPQVWGAYWQTTGPPFLTLRSAGEPDSPWKGT